MYLRDTFYISFHNFDPQMIQLSDTHAIYIDIQIFSISNTEDLYINVDCMCV